MELNWVLLPKGIENGVFRFTVMAVFDQRTFLGNGPFAVGDCTYRNWAQLVGKQLVGFSLRGSALAQPRDVDIKVSHVDAELWSLAFPRQLSTTRTGAGKTAAAARVVLRDGTADTVVAAETLADLTVAIQAGAVSLGPRRSWLAALPCSALLEESGWEKQTTDDDALRSYRADYRGLANLFLPPKPAVGEAEPPITTLKDTALEALRNHLVKVNQPVPGDEAAETQSTGQVPVFGAVALQRIADEIDLMRVDAEGVALLAAPPANPVVDPLTQAVVRHLIATAPCATRNVDEKQGAATHASRMAALMGEPGLLPYVGLVFNASVSVPLKEGILQVLPRWRCAGNSNFKSRAPWTAVGAAGHPLSDPGGRGEMDPRGMLRVGRRTPSAEPEFVLSDHRFDEALRQAVHKAKAERNQSPRIAPGANRVMERELEFNEIRSHDLCLHWRGRAGTSQARRQVAHTHSGEPVLYLEQLVTGIRPMLGRVRKANVEWFNLCERKVSYDALSSGAALPYGDDRGDSIVPLVAFDSRVDDTASVQDLQCGWSGWAIGTPLPSSDASPAHVFGKRETANRGSLPSFRYGEDVYLAARLVYRDGSSAVTTERAVTLLDVEPPMRGTELCVGRRDDNTQPFRLLRWERLQAPQALFERSPPAGGWWGGPSNTTILVATSPIRGRSELRRSTRVLVAGAEPDMWSVWKHGSFRRVAPTTSAYADAARGPTGLDFATVATGNTEVPVLRRRAVGEPVPRTPYHPDPLVRGLVLMLVRRRHAGSARVVPMVDDAGTPLFIRIPLYETTRWPLAPAIRVHVDATLRRNATRPALRRDGATDVVVRAPAGERFALLAFPYGDADEMRAVHAFGGERLSRSVTAMNLQAPNAWFQKKVVAGSDDIPAYEPYLANALILDIEHVRERPETRPTLSLAKAGTGGEREADQTSQPLTGSVFFDPGSTGAVEVHATWRSPIGDLKRRLRGDLTEALSVLVTRVECEPPAELLDPWTDASSLIRPPQEQLLACDHEFKDHRHRRVAYWARGLGRTPQTAQPPEPKGESNALPRLHDGHEGGLRSLDRDDGAGFIRVLASRRPEPPKYQYLVPTFATETMQVRGETRRTRRSRLALHLGGNWFSSGEGEQLAIVLLSREDWGSSYSETRDRFDELVSFWGADPLKQEPAALSRLPDMLTPAHFEECAGSTQLILPASHPKAGATIELMLFDPVPCVESTSWRVEIPLLNPSTVPRPMVRFALARYQQHALPGLELSDVVVADYIQMSDTREAVVVRDPEDRRRLIVTVNGSSFAGTDEAGLPTMQCWLERRCGGKRHDLSAWVREGDPQQCERVWREGRFCWSATLRSEASLRSGSYRVAIEESESYLAHAGGDRGSLTTYFDIVPVA